MDHLYIDSSTYWAREEDVKMSLEFFSTPLSTCLSKIHPLGYFPLHVFDLQKNEGISKDSQNMLTSFL